MSSLDAVNRTLRVISSKMSLIVSHIILANVKKRSMYDAKDVMKGLNAQRLDGTFCDVVLVVDNERLPAHKNVLAAFSPYFKAMFIGQFVESKMMDIPINFTDACVMKALLEYAYTFNLDLIKDNLVLPVLHAANLLQVSSVIEYCLKTLLRLIGTDNCLDILISADLLRDKILEQKAYKYILQNFSEVCLSADFLQLSSCQLTHILESDYIRVTSEDEILDAALRWLKFKENERRSDFFKILRNVRLAVVNLGRLQRLVDEKLPLSPECLLEFEKALLLATETSSQVSLSSDTERRRSALAGAQHREVAVLFCSVAGTRVLKFFSSRGEEVRKLNAPKEFSRITAAICSYEDLYVSDHNQVLRETKIWRFNSRDEEWAPILTLRRTPSRIRFAESDGFLYMCRQHPCQSGIRSYIERYEVATGKWACFLTSRITATKPIVVALNGMLYFLAKHSASAQSATMFRFDPKSEIWTEVAPLEFVDEAMEVCVFDRCIYLWVKSREHMYVYSPVTNEWSTTSTPSVRHPVKLAVMEGVLTAFRVDRGVENPTLVYRGGPKRGGPSWDIVHGISIPKVKRFAAPLYYRLR